MEIREQARKEMLKDFEEQKLKEITFAEEMSQIMDFFQYTYDDLLIEIETSFHGEKKDV